MSHSSARLAGYSIRENGLWLSDRTEADVSTSRHGFCPKLPNDATLFLNGVGGFTTPSGSGSIGATPETPPSSANAADDEYGAGSSIDTAGTRFSGATAWTGVNITNLTNSVTDGRLLLSLSANSVNQRGYTQPVSGAAWKYRAKLWIEGVTTSTSVDAGLWLRESGTGKLCLLNVGYSGGSLIYSQRWTNVTTFGATFNTVTPPLGVSVIPWYLEIELSGSNYVLRWSHSGRHFNVLSTVAKTTPFTTAADEIGVKVYSDNADIPRATFEWFRRIS